MSSKVQRRRLEQSMKSLLAELIRREVKDPRVDTGLVCIHHVNLNRDGSVAHVLVTLVGGDDVVQERACATLQAMAGHLRGRVGRGLRLKRVPELRFCVDDSAELEAKIDAAIRDDANKRSGEEE